MMFDETATSITCVMLDLLLILCYISETKFSDWFTMIILSKSMISLIEKNGLR